MCDQFSAVGRAIRTDSEAIQAIIEAADYSGTENGFAVMTFRASPRLLDYLEERDERPAGWLPITTAPKDMHVLLYGKIRRASLELSLPNAVAVIGYWDEIDGAWCVTTATWAGPFVDATHWMPLPEPPKG